MDRQRPYSWSARLACATVLGAFVAIVALMGYDPVSPSADASFQPEPTSIAFVSTSPTPAPPNPPIAAPQIAARASLAPAERADNAFAASECAFPCVPPAAAPDLDEPDVGEGAEAADDPVEAAVPDTTESSAEPTAERAEEPPPEAPLEPSPNADVAASDDADEAE